MKECIQIDQDHKNIEFKCMELNRMKVRNKISHLHFGTSYVNGINFMFLFQLERIQI